MTPQAAIALSVAPDPEGGSAQLGPRLAAAFRSIPPTALLLLSILSVQLSSALATVLFASLGPAGTAFTSTLFSALVLSLLSRPKLDRRILDHGLFILLFGVVDACMLLPFFWALQRLPLGIVSTIAFLGPLGVSLATSRRPSHFLWIGLAFLGVGLLTPDLGSSLDPIGLGLAGLAALAWAGFVLLSKHMGRLFDGNDALTYGLWAGSVMLLPFTVFEGSLPSAGLLALAGAFGLSLLSAVLPYLLEFNALQRMPARTYGILVTVEPAVGAFVGLIFLGQGIGLRMAAAIALVTLAALGVTLFEKNRQD